MEELSLSQGQNVRKIGKRLLVVSHINYLSDVA